MTSRYGDLSRPPLSEADLSRALTVGDSRWREVVVTESVPSTNAVLAQRVRDGSVAEIVLVAEHQTAGRGRLDRTWVSPPRAGITMSVLIRPDGVSESRWPWVTLLSGLAVAAAVRQVADVEAMLKWPNDVVIDDRKLAGLLAERVNGPGGSAMVIGIGLNVSSEAGELPLDLATSLALEGARVTDRSTIIKAILRRLDGLLTEWERGRGKPSHELRSAYQSACSTLGRQVVVEQPGAEPIAGEAVRIDESGRLLVHTDSGLQAFGAGDVIHARPAT